LATQILTFHPIKPNYVSRP